MTRMVKKLIRLRTCSISGASKPFTTLHRALARRVRADRRQEQNMLLALMLLLVMKMWHILRQRMTERRFPTEDEAREARLLHGSHPALRAGVQIW